MISVHGSMVASHHGFDAKELSHHRQELENLSRRCKQAVHTDTFYQSTSTVAVSIGAHLSSVLCTYAATEASAQCPRSVF